MPSVTIHIDADAAELARYGKAVAFGAPELVGTGDASPFVVMAWLAKPSVRELIITACGPGLMPMQVSHLMECPRSIESGQRYVLEASTQTTAATIELGYRVSDIDGQECARGVIGFVAVSEDKIEQILQ